MARAYSDDLRERVAAAVVGPFWPGGRGGIRSERGERVEVVAAAA